MKKEWEYEPNRLEFSHLNYPCLIVRNPGGALCGYVGVPPGHPWHKKHYDEVAANVHGGLTYSDSCSDHVCHVPKPGETDDVWWVGFDCSHVGDYSPKYGAFDNAGQYRNVSYVTAECIKLAFQAYRVTCE